MIRIDKQKGPEEAIDKCAKLTKDLQDLYGKLRDVYRQKDLKSGGVELSNADYVKLVRVYTGKEPKAKTSTALAAAIPPVVFGTELVVSAEQEVVTVPDFPALYPDWLKVFTRCLKQYEEVHQSTVEAWREAFTKKFPASKLAQTQVDTFLDQVPLHFLWHALGGRPFVNLRTAQSPEWFRPGEFERWKALDGISPKVRAALFSTYQAVLAQVLEDVLDTYDDWLAPTVWMYGAKAAPPNEQALFGYATDLFGTRMAGKSGVDYDMFPAELKALRTRLKQDEIRRTGQHYAAVRALREVVSKKMQTKTRTSYQPILGFKSATFDSAWYSGHGIKEALMNTHHGKCVFCESKVRSLAHGDVEHFRPKAGYDQGHRFNTSGYFWQAYRWENLFFSCQVCNQVYKENHFPVMLDKRGVEVRQTFDNANADERPVLIDPGQEDPREHIRFDPRTGQAYPYRLLRYALEAEKVQDPATAIWANADRIPADLDIQEISVDPKTNKFVVTKSDAAEWDKLPAEAPDDCLRGLRTIQILGLNRWELVHRRLAHLRGLRGLYLAAQANDPAARDALAAAQAAQAEFSSLAIDAVATWERAPVPSPGQSGDWWLNKYNTLLSEEPEYSYDDKDEVEFKDAVWMYYVPTDWAKSDDKRLLVYLKQDVEMEDVDEPKQGPGWYLAVPPEDGKLVAEFVRGKNTEKIKLRDLGNYNNVWTKFKNATVTVKGPFSSPTGF